MKKLAASEEVFNQMMTNLRRETLEVVGSGKLATALDHLNDAAKLLDEVGLEKASLMVIELIEKTAWEVPSQDSATSGLSSEKMEKNLKEKGWVFNANDGKNDKPSKEPASKETKEPAKSVDSNEAKDGEILEVMDPDQEDDVIIYGDK